MASRFETGTYTNRGFASVDIHGFCEVFSNWLGRSYANRGAGWTLIDNQSAVNTGTFTIPDHTNDRCYRVGHGFITGQEVYVASTNTLPAGLSANVPYKVVYVDADNFKLSQQLVDALAGTPVIDITSAGTGFHTVTAVPYKVYCNKAAPVVNDTCNFIKISYVVSGQTPLSTGARIMSCLWWDVVNHIPRGIWHHAAPSCTINGTNTYWFNGNTDFIDVALDTDRMYAFGTFNMNTLLNESNTVVSTLTVGITAGSNVTVTLGSGEAANFTLNKRYFIYDFVGHSWVDYVKVTGIDLGLNTITLQTVSYNFPSGARIGVYPHRFYAFGDGVISPSPIDAMHDNTNYQYSAIPYYSSSTPSVLNTIFHQQSYMIHTYVSIATLGSVIDYGSPEDEGYYYALLPNIVEYYSPANLLETKRRLLGTVTAGSMYVVSNRNLTNRITKRTINGKLYSAFGSYSNFVFVTGTPASTFLFPVEDL